MAIAPCVAVKEPAAARTAEAQRVVALHRPTGSSGPAHGAHDLHARPDSGVDDCRDSGGLSGPQLAGVDRVREDLTDVGLREVDLGCHLPIREPCGGQIVGLANDRGSRLVDPKRRGLALADDPVGSPVAAGHSEPASFRGIAFADSLGELAAVRLGFMGLADELVPAVGVRAEQSLVGEQDHHASRVKVVLNRDEGLLEVAQEAAHVADDEYVEGTCLGRGNHRLPRRRAPGRGPARGRHGPLEATIGQTVPSNGMVLLLALRIGAEVVPLAGSRLAEPSGGSKTGDAVERGWQGAFHGVGSFAVGSVSTLPLARRCSTSRSATTRAKMTGLVGRGLASRKAPGDPVWPETARVLA